MRNLQLKLIKWSSLFIVLGLLVLIFIKVNPSDGWLGFWGGIIGSFMGVIGAIVVLNKQIAQDKESLSLQKEQYRKEKIDNTFFNLLEMHNELKDKLSQKNLFDNYYKRLKEEAQRKIKELGNNCLKNDLTVLDELCSLYKTYITMVEEKAKDLYISLDDFSGEKENYEGYLRNRLSEEVNTHSLENIKLFEETNTLLDQVHYIQTLRKDIEENSSKDDLMLRYIQVYEFSESIKDNRVSHSNALLSLVYKYCNHGDDFSLICVDKDKQEIINNVSDHYYSDMAAYFRLTHRIIKYVNDNVENKEEALNYFGFFRATMDEIELLVLFYNSFFSKRGVGLKKQLSGTSFFGENGELGENNNFIQHFSKEKLIWGNNDLEIMRKSNG